LNPHSLQPFSDGPSRELRPIVTSKLAWHTSTAEQLAQPTAYILTRQLSRDIDRQAFPAEIIKDYQEP
jgi:hypothetical protein